MSRYLRRVVAVALSSSLLSYALIPAASAQSVAPDINRSAPQDWSNRHQIYANPDTRDEAASKGTLALEQWKEKYKDPRFALQVARKQLFVQPNQNSGFSAQQLQWYKRNDRNPPAAAPEIHRDWSNVLGGASGVGRAGVFPAKFSFDIYATPSCANDFVVHTTASSGAASSGAFGARNGTFTGAPTAGQTVTITHTGSPPLVLTASSTSNLGLNFLIGATSATSATNLANAIARNGGTAGVTATSAAAVVTVTSLTSGTTPNITLAETLGNFAWAGTTLTGGGGTPGQPTIIAFNQLYSSCGSTPNQAVPSTLFSFNTGTGAFTETSPVLSIDGGQVAFVQRVGTAASLVLLKWSNAGTVGAPATPTSVSAAAYAGCTAPCMTTIAFNGGVNDTNSSPYYDYFNHVVYVGADNGTLHKFTGVFNGTPAEVTTGGWPATVSTGNRLSSPVLDFNTGLVFVGSGVTSGAGGQLHSVNAANGTVASSAQLAALTGQDINGNTVATTGVSDSPIVDSTAQRVYVFVENDTSNGSGCPGTTGSGNVGNNAPCKAVYQFPTNVSISGSTGAKVNVGRGQIAGRVLFSGTFDNAYYTSANGASPSGSLYVCGGLQDATYSDSKKPTLWKISIANNVMGSPTEGPILLAPLPYAGNTADCSPVTQIMNGADEYIYASVSALGNFPAVCTGACVYMVKTVSSSVAATWNTTTPVGAGLAAPGGTGGIIVDNISPTTGASQIYYSTRTNPGNAVQASQAGLN